MDAVGGLLSKLQNNNEYKELDQVRLEYMLITNVIRLDVI